jgi:hypothetical protein
MTPEKRNPASLAAGRASKAFFSATELLEDNPSPLKHQCSFNVAAAAGLVDREVLK